MLTFFCVSTGRWPVDVQEAPGEFFGTLGLFAVELIAEAILFFPIVTGTLPT